MIKKLLFISLILVSLAQISSAQNAPSPAKKKAAKEIAANTILLFPVQFFEDSFNTMNNEKSAEVEKDITESLFKKLEKSTLTPEEKEAFKPQITEFTSKISQMMKTLIMKDFNIRTQTNKSLEKNYVTLFTIAELQKLNKFFKTSDGQQFVKTFNEMVTGEMKGKTGNANGDDEKEFEKLAKGLGEKLIVKFTDSLIPKVMDDINKYVEVWAAQIPKKMEKEMTNGSMKKEMDKFMSQNFTN
jgi:hypothetical protein